jgi:hypothetical protein
VQNYIPEGYVEKAFLRGVPGLYADFRIEYRPVLPQNRTVIVRAVGRLPDDQQDPAAAKAVAKQLVSWDLANIGKPVSITVENVLRLRPALFQRLFNVVLGMEAPDIDPQAPVVEVAAQATDLLEAAINGRLTADVRDEAAVKN